MCMFNFICNVNDFMLKEIFAKKLQIIFHFGLHSFWEASNNNIKIIYVPQPRKLVFPLQLRVKQCCIFRYRGIQCRNWTAHAHYSLTAERNLFLILLFLRTALAPYWQSLVHLNCACSITTRYYYTRWIKSISCEHCRSSRNNPHCTPRKVIYYFPTRL